MASLPFATSYWLWRLKSHYLYFVTFNSNNWCKNFMNDFIVLCKLILSLSSENASRSGSGRRSQLSVSRMPQHCQYLAEVLKLVAVTNSYYNSTHEAACNNFVNRQTNKWKYFKKWIRKEVIIVGIKKAATLPVFSRSAEAGSCYD